MTSNLLHKTGQTRTRKRHPLIVGTFILTVTGAVSRLIGFFYRIYLSRLFGEEGMGIYQLLSPVLSLSFSLTAAGYQTAISKLVAEQSATERRPSLHPMTLGLCISLPLSLLCNFILFTFAEPIAATLLQEPRTANMLRILSFSVPLSAVHSCINGYFYGIKKAGIPAGSQLLEQLVRVGSVYTVSAWYASQGLAPSINIAVLGLSIGEFFSMAMTVFAILPACLRHASGATAGRPQPVISLRNISPRKRTDFARDAHTATYGRLLSMALPLTANRIVLNLLQSVESVSIPLMLRLYGYDTVTSLSVYGVLTGMAMPFIYFPNALTGSVAVMLLPMISESYALGDLNAVYRATVRTVKYCVLMGFCCMACFVLFGRWAGTTLFDSPLAGYFITTLGFICPFLYLDTTLSSILQGLGKAGHIFIMNVICLLLRLVFVFLAVPRFGITGYLWGLLASQLALGVLYLGCLYRFFRKSRQPRGPHAA